MLGVRPPEHPEDEEVNPMDERRRLFHSQVRFRPDDVVRQNNFAVDICRFDERGKHVQMAKHCPHFELEDEEGIRIRPN